MTYIVAEGTFITGRVGASGSVVLRADHRQIAAFLREVGVRFGVELRWYRTGNVPGAASAQHHDRIVSLDSDVADRLVVLHGPSAVVFILLHEVGHLRHPEQRGRTGERTADSYAAEAMRSLGYRSEEIYRAAEATLLGTADDGTHDSGEVRLRMLAQRLWPQPPMRRS